MTPTRSVALSLALGLAAATMTTTAAAAKPPTPVGAQLAEVRAATAQYHSVDVALAAGYEPASPCVPSMGFHYQRGVADARHDLTATSPEILVYAPRPNGSLRLVAVEYATWDPDAALFGRSFDPPAPPGEGPPFHTLHAWVWQGNPHGTFSALNPTVHCD